VRRSTCLRALVGLALTSGPARAETTHPFLSSFNGSDTPSGSFRVAGRVGVDQVNGDVYVVDISSVFAGTGAVEVFDDESRTFLREIAGEDTPAGSFAFSRIGTSGVTAHDGEAYVADTRNNVVDVFDSTGAYVRQLTGIVAPTGVAVDADGHLWVIRRIREFPLRVPTARRS
jgi:DNA-binding beta-propeller fold protein YncE